MLTHFPLQPEKVIMRKNIYIKRGMHLVIRESGYRNLKKITNPIESIL